MKLPEDAIERLLDAWPVARLATVGPDGAPHQVPIVFARSEGRLWSPADGKPKAGRPLARLANVEAEARVALLLDAYEPDWRRLWWIRVDAEAEVVRPASEAEVAPALSALRRKYPQYATTPVLSGPLALLRIRPLRVSSWCAGPEAAAAARGAC